jgi:AraC-like DNA-binding protein
MFRATKIAYYLDRLCSQDLPVEALLANTGLRKNELQREACLVTAEQHRQVICNILDQTGNSGLAFALDGDDHCVDAGIVGYGMLSAATAGEALAIWMDYSQHLVGVPMRQTVEESAEHWIYSLPDKTTIWDHVTIFCCETLLLNVKWCKPLTGLDITIKQVELAYPAPPHRNLYTEHFNCPIIFNAPQTCLVVSSPGLNTPVKSRNDELMQLCRRHCKQLAENINQTDPLLDRIRQILATDPAHAPTIEDLADHFHCSVSSLQRRLQSQGLSYRVLVNQFRSEFAQTQLRDARLSTKEVAFSLGYSEVSAFRRAFKSWTGATVQDYLHSA